MIRQLRQPPSLAEERTTLRALREAIEARIEKDIALLDDMDGDPDREPDECAELVLQAEIRGGANVLAH